ncbi:MAG TPA: hypothetical protein VJH92_01050 [Candidatus Nanoarchaeia archaeon]|nr:hypothetical protein [Candidatus Nanoarchaeia archaeon]
MPDKKQKTQFIITKKIAKHGSQAIIVIPRILESQLKPGTIVELSINILDNGENKITEEMK